MDFKSKLSNHTKHVDPTEISIAQDNQSNPPPVWKHQRSNVITFLSISFCNQYFVEPLALFSLLQSFVQRQQSGRRHCSHLPQLLALLSDQIGDETLRWHVFDELPNSSVITKSYSPICQICPQIPLWHISGSQDLTSQFRLKWDATNFYDPWLLIINMVTFLLFPFQLEFILNCTCLLYW